MSRQITLTVEHVLTVDDDVTLEDVMDDWTYYLDECEICADILESSME